MSGVLPCLGRMRRCLVRSEAVESSSQKAVPQTYSEGINGEIMSECVGVPDVFICSGGSVATPRRGRQARSRIPRSLLLRAADSEACERLEETGARGLQSRDTAPLGCACSDLGMIHEEKIRARSPGHRSQQQKAGAEEGRLRQSQEVVRRIAALELHDLRTLRPATTRRVREASPLEGVFVSFFKASCRVEVLASPTPDTQKVPQVHQHSPLLVKRGFSLERVVVLLRLSPEGSNPLPARGRGPACRILFRRARSGRMRSNRMTIVDCPEGTVVY